jgi:uncharacterized damage-inducible protein DinB
MSTGAKSDGEQPAVVGDLVDPRRPDPPYVNPERALLESWLEFHRTTLLMKCEGLGDAERKAGPVASSSLSLHGLVRHMAEVERGWFRRALLCDTDAPRFWSNGFDDRELIPLDEADWDADLVTWQAECEASRAAAAPLGLDHTGIRDGEPVSLRWIYVHMIEEYARHNGHADLLRELVDGRVGW